MNEIAVKFLPNVTPLGIRPITSVPGVQSVQVAHVAISVDDIEQEHVVVSTHPVKPDRARCLAIVQEIELAFPGAVVSVLLDDTPGAAAMFAPRDAAESSQGIAAAVSCMKAVWGWDESATFEIRVNDEVVSLRATAIDGHAWSHFAT